MKIFLYFFCLDTEKVTKRDQEQTNAKALCFFLNGRMLHPSFLKKAFTRNCSAFVRGLRTRIFFFVNFVKKVSMKNYHILEYWHGFNFSFLDIIGNLMD